MKTMKKYLLFLIATCFTFVACNQNEFDLPPLVEPVYTGTPVNTTIAELKQLYLKPDLNSVDTITRNSKGENIVIKGIVTANDISGNIYKQIVIQDATAAIVIGIEQSSLAALYNIGQEVVVNCTGIYIGKYNEMYQLGYKAFDDKTNKPIIGRMTEVTAKNHIYLNGWPGKPLAADTVTLATLADPTKTLGLQAKLICLKNMYFAEAGKATYSAKDASTNRDLLDSKGNKIIIRTSNYSNFSQNLLPTGTLNVTSIFSVYGTTFQLLIPDSTSVLRTNVKPPAGAKVNPYTIDFVQQNQTNAVSGWVSGYIVGTPAPGVTTITKNADITFAAPFAINNYVVLAAAANTTDYTKCVVVPLPANSAMRIAVNLIDNPSNIGKQVKINGALVNQLGVAGINITDGSNANFELEGAGLLLDAKFDTGLYGFAESSVAGDQIWAVDTKSKYLKMSGYSGSNLNNEDWVISPEFSTAGRTSAKLTFDHAINFVTTADMVNMQTVWVTTNYTIGAALSSVTWTKMVIPTYPPGTNWSFVNSGIMPLPSEFLGKTRVRIAFKYVSTTAVAGTWELKNVLVQ